jgi:hypothetical protein
VAGTPSGRPFSSSTPDDTEETAMTLHYPNEALEAELAYRRERMLTAARHSGRRLPWLSARRRQH